MVANKGANPNYYGVSVDTLSTTKAYSDTGTVTIPVGVISSAGTKRLNVRAYDSRSLSKLQYKDVTVYDYNKPKINASAARLNNFEAQTTLKISGEYSRLTIGGADKNTITKVEYRYREKGGTWGSYVEPSTTLSAGKFSCSEITLTLENTKAFEIEVKVTDKFGTLTASTIPLSVDVGQAILFVSTNKKTCFVNGVEVATKDFVGDAITALFPAGSSVTNALYPVGAVVCMSTNKNPSSMYGGTWTLIDKGFASSNTTNENYFTASTNVVEEAVWVTRAGQTMRIRLSVTINVEITDTGLTLGTLNLSNIGISKIPINIVGNVTYSDGANGGIAWSLNETTGELKVTDVFDLTPLPSGNGFNIDVTFPVVYSQMLDSVCDKFYWKRTA